MTMLWKCLLLLITCRSALLQELPVANGVSPANPPTASLDSELAPLADQPQSILAQAPLQQNAGMDVASPLSLQSSSPIGPSQPLFAQAPVQQDIDVDVQSSLDPLNLQPSGSTNQALPQLQQLGLGIEDVFPSYYIHSKLVDKVLDAISIQTGSQVQSNVKDVTRLSNQLWNIETPNQLGYSIISLASSTNLVLTGLNSFSYVTIATRNGADVQTWKLQGTDVMSHTSGQCLDLFGASTANGALVGIWACGVTGGDARQQWETVLYAVDGGWTDWSAWTACSVTCGYGTISKYRNCTNPVPAGGGSNCSENGESSETESHLCSDALCVVNGSWTEWGVWEPCSVSCSRGTQIRRRFCTNPCPENGGSNCPVSDPTIDRQVCSNCAAGCEGACSPHPDFCDQYVVCLNGRDIAVACDKVNGIRLFYDVVEKTCKRPCEVTAQEGCRLSVPPQC